MSIDSRQPFSGLTAMLAFCVLFAVPAFSQTSATPQLKAGAARVDITPAAGDLPAQFTSIHDHIFVRALLLESGTTRAIIAMAEVPMIQGDIHRNLIDRLSREFGVAPDYIVVGNTHTHNALRVATTTTGESGTQPAQASTNAAVARTVQHVIPIAERFNQSVINATVEAVRQAQAALRPARAGYARGAIGLIANRNAWHPTQHRVIDGIDRSDAQPIDDSLGVYKFESMSGEPIALLLDYGIEPVVYIDAKQISGDVPGAVSRYVEEQLGGNAVALFAVGPPETPRYRVGANAVPPRGPDAAARIMDAMGLIIGEEALARAAQISTPSSTLRLYAARDTLRCPGKITTPRNLPNHCAYTEGSTLPACQFTDHPADPVQLSMGLLRLGDVAYVHADANVVTALADKVKRASPLAHTRILSANFGPLRFVVDDAAYAQNTYPATDTRAAPGCAEQGFVDRALRMIQQGH